MIEYACLLLMYISEWNGGCDDKVSSVEKGEEKVEIQVEFGKEGGS